MSIEERKRKYLSGSRATATCLEILLTGRYHFTVTVIFFLCYDSNGRINGGNNPAFRGYITDSLATGCIAGEGLYPRQVQTGTSCLESSFNGLAHFCCRAIGAYVKIIFLLIIES